MKHKTEEQFKREIRKLKRDLAFSEKELNHRDHEIKRLRESVKKNIKTISELEKENGKTT